MEIYTAGHSTREIDEFISLLQQNQVSLVADVRAFPGSRKYPQFNQKPLSDRLNEKGIEYLHFAGLGGRRKPVKNSSNTAWRNKSFQAYADYMDNEKFKAALSDLESSAMKRKTAVMCSEAVWWRCHRRLIADALLVKGWNVIHILSPTKNDIHKLNEAAKYRQGRLFYSD